MLRLSDAIRPYWAYGINNITSNKSEIFTRWLELGKNFQIYNQIQADSFDVSTSQRNEFLIPISQDCNRFATATFESAIKLEDVTILPKTLSWLIVKLYYSAFYAGHLLLRLLGYSLSQIDRNTVSKIESIADLFGYKNGINIEKGFYVCDYSDRSSTIKFKKAIKSGEDGSHGMMWKLLSQKLNHISNDILRVHKSADYQSISVKLGEFNYNLNYMGCTNGGWLSKIRNDINYKHLHGTWFPYQDYKKYYTEFHNYLDDWKSNPMSIELSNLSGKELLRFISTCQFLIALSKETCIDMYHRCSDGPSFQSNGAIALLNLQKIKIN